MSLNHRLIWVSLYNPHHAPRPPLGAPRPRPHGNRLRPQPLRSLPPPAQLCRNPRRTSHHRPLPLVRSSPRPPRRRRHPHLRPPPHPTHPPAEHRNLATRQSLPRRRGPRPHPRCQRHRPGRLPHALPLKMPIAKLTIELEIPHAQSLKDRRQVVRSLKDKLRHAFNLSVAELDDGVVWNRATLGIATISSSTSYLTSQIQQIDHAINRFSAALSAEVIVSYAETL